MVSANKLWTAYLVSNLIAIAILVGVSWVIIYYLAWIPFTSSGGIGKLLELLANAEPYNTLWWREFLSLAFDILIMVIGVVGTWWSLGHFAVFAREQGKWRRYYKSLEGKKDVWVLRFTLWQRIQHVWMIITFILTAFTGFAMHFANNPYWHEFMASRDLYVKLHVIFGWLMGILVIVHFAYYGVRALLAKLAGKSLMEEFPILQLYTWTFVKNFVKRMLWLATPKIGKPKVFKYDCEQLFEYWGVYWGIAVLGIPGAIMSVYGPKVLNGVLWIMHVKEAVLAVVFILMVHIAYAHMVPTVFPMDSTYIHGKMPLRRIREEHELWYEYLVRKGVVSGEAGGGSK